MLVPYTGGPIVRCPLVHTSFWGPSWGDAAHTALANNLNQFNQDFLASEAMNVIRQYGVTGGVFSGATYLNWVPSTLTPASIQSIIQSCIGAGAFPEPSDPATSSTVPILIVYLDEHTVINGGGRSVNFPGAADYGYHDHFVTSAGHPFIYAFNGHFDVNLTTVVSSHEFCEMVTDPLYNAWTPDHAFHEIGDYCEGTTATITVSGRTWTIQAEWSDADNMCRATAPAAIPPIMPGPMGAIGAGALGGEQRGRGPRATGPAAFMPMERLLPLPPKHVDKNFKVAVRDEDQNRYLNRLFHPLRHDHFFHDFPAFLRTAADFVEVRSKGTPPAPTPPAGGGAETPDHPGAATRGGVRARNT